jgi:hypothetical protein
VSRAQREKGKRGERAVATIYQEHGFDVRRAGNAAGLADLHGLKRHGIHPEVKSCATVDLPAWMRQAEAEAPDLQIPAVHWRRCRRGASTDWYVNVPLQSFIELLKRGAA